VFLNPNIFTIRFRPSSVGVNLHSGDCRRVQKQQERRRVKPFEWTTGDLTWTTRN